MVNDPIRSKLAPSKGRSPTPAEVKEARHKPGLTQPQAAALIYFTLSGWQRFEQGERNMHPALWELFLEKTKKEQS